MTQERDTTRSLYSPIDWKNQHGKVNNNDDNNKDNNIININELSFNSYSDEKLLIYINSIKHVNYNM